MAPTMDAQDLQLITRFMFLSLEISLATVIAFHKLGVWVRVARVLFPIVGLLRSGLKLYLNANVLPSDWALNWKDTEADELKECQDAAVKAAQKYKDIQIQLLSEAETIEALSANVASLNGKVAKQAKEIAMWQKSPAAATDARVVRLQELLDDAVHWKNIQQVAHLHEAKRNRVLKLASRQLRKSTCDGISTYLQWLENAISKMCTAVPERGQFRAPENGEDDQEFGLDWQNTRALQLKVQQLLNAKIWADASAEAVKGALEAKSECTRLKQEFVVQQCRGKMFESNADVLKSEVASLEAKVRTLSIQLRDAPALQTALDAQRKQNEHRAKVFQLKEAELKKKLSQAENATREIIDKRKKTDEEIDRLKAGMRLAEIDSGEAAPLTKNSFQGAAALAQRTTGPAVVKQASQSTPLNLGSTPAQNRSTTAQRVNPPSSTNSQQPRKASIHGTNTTSRQPTEAQVPSPLSSTEFSVPSKQPAPPTELHFPLTTKPTTSLPFSFATPPTSAPSQTPPVACALPSTFTTPKKAQNNSTITAPTAPGASATQPAAAKGVKKPSMVSGPIW